MRERSGHRRSPCPTSASSHTAPTGRMCCSSISVRILAPHSPSGISHRRWPSTPTTSWARCRPWEWWNTGRENTSYLKNRYDLWICICHLEQIERTRRYVSHAYSLLSCWDMNSAKHTYYCRILLWMIWLNFDFVVSQDVLDEYMERVKRRGHVKQIDPTCLKWSPFVPPTSQGGGWCRDGSWNCLKKSRQITAANSASAAQQTVPHFVLPRFINIPGSVLRPERRVRRWL